MAQDKDLERGAAPETSKRGLSDADVGFGAPSAAATPTAKKTFSDADVGIEPEARGFGGWARDAAAWLTKGAISVPEAAVGLADIPTGGRVGKFLENEGGAIGFRPKPAKEIVNDWHSDAYKANQAKFAAADGIVDKAKVAIENPSLILGGVVESLPSMGAGGVVARGVAGAAGAGFLGQGAAKLAQTTAGGIAAGAVGEGAVMAGSQAESIRQETPDGLLTPAQSGAALATGVIGGGLGVLGGKVAQKLGVGDAETMLAQGTKGIQRQNAEEAAAIASNLRAAKSIPRQVVEGAISEGLLEELPQSVAETVIQNLSLGKDWTDGLDESIVMGVLSGGAMGGAAAGYKGFAGTGAQDTNAPADPNAQPAPVNPGLVRVRNAFAEQLAAERAKGAPAPVLNEDALLANGIAPQARINPDQMGKWLGDVPAAPAPSQRMGLDATAGGLTGAAALAVDSGASQAFQPQQYIDPADDPSMGSDTPITAAADVAQPGAPDADPYAGYEVDYESLSPVEKELYDWEMSQRDAPDDAFSSLAALDDSDIPFFDQASNATDEEFLRALGASDEEINDAIQFANQPRGTQGRAAVNAQAQANEPRSTGQGAGQAQSTGQVTKPASQVANPPSIADQIASLEAQADAIDAKARDWASRNYKANAKELPQYAAKGGPADVGEANEQRRLKTILDAKVQAQSLRKQAQELRDQGNAQAQQAAKAAAARPAAPPAVPVQATQAAPKSPSIAQLHAISRKQINDMTDSELMQLAQATVPSHSRYQKLQKAIQTRGLQALAATNQGAKQDGTQAPQAQQAGAQQQAPGAASGQAVNRLPAAAAAQAGQPATKGGVNGSAQTANPAAQASAPDAAQSQAAAAAIAKEGATRREAERARNLEASERWTRMTTAERQAAASKASGLKTIQKKNVHTKPWADLSEKVRAALLDAVAPVNATENKAVKAEQTNASASKNAEIPTEKSPLAIELAKYGSYDLMFDAVNGTVSASLNGATVGEILFEQLPNSRWNVADMGVDAKHRRKGLASAMLDMANNGYGGKVTFENTILTEDGAKFAKASKLANTLPEQDISAIEAAAAQAATSPNNDTPAPTEAQKDAGNYKKGHLRLHGLEIAIENPAGTQRNPAWSALKNHYGYFKGSVGADKDHVDVFLTDKAEDASLPVFVVDQKHRNGKFDEHKVIMGAATEAEARQTYLQNYEQGWTGLDAITEMSLEDFKAWVMDAEKTKKPAAAASLSASAPQSSRITDVGEKIGGARKDLWTGFKDDLRAVPDDQIQAQPLSKVWPQTDYQKLIDAGQDPAVVALVRSMRDAVPVKPRQSHKLKRWAEQVQLLRSLAMEMLDGKLEQQKLREQLRVMGSRDVLGVLGRAELYEAMGHSKSLEGITFGEHHYSLYRGRENVNLWVVEQAAKATAFSNWPREIATGDTKEAALQAFKQAYGQLGEVQQKKSASFDIISETYTRNYYVGKKLGRNYAKLAGPFKTVKEARAYRDANEGELTQKLQAYKLVPQERADENRPRVGQDMRNGVDVTPDQFRDTFGFRGVEFGNWVGQGKRQQDLNDAYEALMDLAAVLQLPPKALSLNGELGMAFGARGTGGVGAFNAHYEPGKVVINLTKRSGAGSLGHEWWHAVDNYFSRMRKSADGFMTSSRDVLQQAKGKQVAPSAEGVRPEVVQAFAAVMRAINGTALRDRSAKLDERRSKDYWSTDVELSARAFEGYLLAKLQDQDASNDYLVNVISPKAWETASEAGVQLGAAYPYPSIEEMPAIRAGFDQFFAALETKETDKGVALFRTSEVFSGDKQAVSTGLSVEQAQKAVDEALAGLGSFPPVNVVLRGAEIGVTAPDGVMGALIPAQGRIFIVASAHSSGRDVVETLFHEMFHLGLRNVLPSSDYVQTMLDLAKRDNRVQQYALEWKKYAPDAPMQLQALRESGLSGSALTAHYEALAIEEGLAVVAQELAARKLPGTAHSFRVRQLAGWLASVADRMGLSRLASGIRKLTYNAAERFVMSALDAAGQGVDARSAVDAVYRTAMQEDRSEGGAMRGLDLAQAMKVLEQSQAGMSAQMIAQVNKVVDGIRKTWVNAPEVVVAYGIEDAKIPKEALATDSLQRSEGAEGDPEGFYWDGKVYLLADMLHTPNDVARVFFHEALGHHGLRGAFGKQLDVVLEQITVMRKADVASKLTQYGLKNTPKGRRVAAEEVLATMAQSTPRLNLVQRAIAAIRSWLRANVPGLQTIKLSDAEIINNYILPARAWVERGGPDGNGPRGGQRIEPVMSRSSMKSVEANIARGREALAVALTDKTTVHRAMFRNGLGWVDFVWGSEGTVKPTGKTKGGMGLSHILEARQRKDGLTEQAAVRFLDEIVEAVALGTEFNRKQIEQSTRVGIEHESTIVWLTKADGSNAWVVTGYEKVPSGAVAGRATTAPTHATASRTRNGVEGTKPILDDDGDLGNILFSRSKVAELKDKGLQLAHTYMSHPGKVSLWDKTVGTMRHLAERKPAFKPVFEAAQQFIDDVASVANEAAQYAPRLIPRVETLTDMRKKPISVEDNRALGKALFGGTLEWGRDQHGKVMPMDALKAKYAGLSVDTKAEILLAAGKVRPQLMAAMRGKQLQQFESFINSRFESTILKPGVRFSHKELREFFNLSDGQISLYDEARATVDKSLDMTARAEMLRALGRDWDGFRDMVMDALTLTDAWKLLDDELERRAKEIPDSRDQMAAKMFQIRASLDKAQELMDSGYMPLQRFGKYTLDVQDKDGERIYFGMFESKADSNRMAEALRREHPDAAVTQGTMNDQQYKLFAGITPETAELFGSMLGLDAQGNDAKDQAFQEFLKLSKNNHSALKRLIHRKGIMGYSEDVGRVLASFVYSNARLAATGLNAGKMENAINDLNTKHKQEGELGEIAAKLRDYIQDPQEEGQAIRGMLFAQYLGGSIASAMVNMTQPFAVTLPWLSQFGGMAKAGRLMAQAVKDMVKRGHQYEPDLAHALKMAEDDGVVSPQEIHQLMAQARGAGGLRTGDGTKKGDALASAANYWEKGKVLWGQPFALAEQFNRRSTFIAAYRLAKEQGKANPAEFARQAVVETQFLYTKANKPQWARGAIGGTVFTFKTYSVSFLELMQRTWNAGEPGSPERAAGRRAVGWAMLMLMLMGGAGGLPFVEDVEDLVDGAGQMMGYNLSSKQWRQQLAADVLGAELAGFLENGLSGLPGAPIDISGRMGMGNLIPGTGLLLNKQSSTRDVMEMIGPAGDLVARGFSGLKSVASGVVNADAGSIGRGAMEVMPAAVRNAVKGADMAASGMYKDTKGYKIIDTSLDEALWKMIGFQPRAVAQVQESNSFMQRSKSFYIQTSNEIRSQWAQALFDKDEDAVKRVRERLDKWNAQNPDQPIRIKMPDIWKRVHQMGKDRTDRIADTAPKALRQQLREMAQEQGR